ncbi:hypothetical protein [Aeromonas caviae]|uniref:hypothetical protein n=1 Tax=Aeromonas caviae TaxID=648 RepID=UPI0019200CC5|nr:hypothetical protein [Aeromonas caviae]MBL0645889.1 hypothetical protein [Aeromonas caviae]
MSGKEYPLDVYDVSCDRQRIFMSRGHHDIHEFMRAVRAEGYDCFLCVPEYRWVKVVPDSTGEHSHIFAFVKEGTRGAFPATYSWEAHKDETYEAKHQATSSVAD